MSYVTVIGSDSDNTQPKIDLGSRGPKGTGILEHIKQLEKIDKVRKSRPNKTSVFCMLKNHDECPEYDKKAVKCWCLRCVLIGKH